MSTITHETPNGVDVTQLGQTVEAIQNDPTLAIFTFRATNDWLGGGHSRTQVKGSGAPARRTSPAPSPSSSSATSPRSCSGATTPRTRSRRCCTPSPPA